MRNTEATKQKDYLRQIPQVEELLNHPQVKNLLDAYPRSLVVKTIRSIFTEIRKLPQEKLAQQDLSYDTLSHKVIQQVTEKMQPSLKRVINATGIILHTGLGRALLNESAQQALIEAARYYCNLEFDLSSGERGERDVHIEQLLCSITGAEAALAVNNNAAAVLLVLNTLAQDREVIVSRGQLIEIGGSFRIPEVMSKSGARLVEVGTTNKTHFDDYRNAIGPDTAVLLRVHTSNFRVVGFVAEVELSELARLAKQKRLWVVDDIGSGALVDLSKFSLGFKIYEPTVQHSLKEGADVVTFSGDKLLGGPQAGIILGKKRLISAMHKNQLYRSLRLDKLRLAALEATLRTYFDENEAIKKIPVFQMIFKPFKELEGLAQEFVARLQNALDNKTIKIMLEDGTSQVGGGSLPTEEIPTKLIVLQPLQMSVEELVYRLRSSSPPVIGRIYKNKLCLDLRTVQESDFEILLDILLKAITTIK